MTEPQLSVIIPSYRRPAALERTLRALASLPEAHATEIIVCDDGSPPDDAAGYARVTRSIGLPRLRLISQENAGPAAARNAGAAASQAALLLFLDDDCAPTEGLFAAHLRERAAGERVAVMGHVAWSPDVRVTPFMELVVRGAQFNYGAIADPARVPFTSFYTANCSLWREDMERAGWFDASLPPYMEDTEFAYRLTRSGTRIAYRSEAVVHHEHTVEIESYLERQRRAGRAAVEVVRRHPELFDVIGVADVADVALREQFYTTLLRYAFVCGVEEGLGEDVRSGAITGAELRGKLDRWMASWAVQQAGRVRGWRERAEALTVEVERRDVRLAQVVQDKDDRIAALETQLTRFNNLPPVRLYRRLASRIRRDGTRETGGTDGETHHDNR